MKKFRVMRGIYNPYTKAQQTTGMTYDAEDAREAVRKDKEADDKSRAAFFGIFSDDATKSHPVVAVYELIPVPEDQWK